MATIFSLPREIRDEIYELCLRKDQALEVIDRAGTGFTLSHQNQPNNLGIGLFRLSKYFNEETVWYFYRKNRFDLSDLSGRQVYVFLRTIGNPNAAYIKEAVIPFPRLLCPFPDVDYFEELRNISRGKLPYSPPEFNHEYKLVKRVARYCTNLRVITITMEKGALERGMDVRTLNMSKETATLVFDVVKNQLTSLQHLQTVTVLEFRDDPNSDVLELVEERGWQFLVVRP